MPTLLYAASRTHYPVPAVALVELRAFRGVVDVAAVEDYHGIADRAHAVGRELAYRQYRVEAAAAVGPSVDEPAAAIVIP